MITDWSALATRLETLAEEIGGDADELLMMTAAQGYHLLCATDPAAPSWIPFLSSAIRSAGTNPDTVYAFAPIDGRGTYHITGVQGRVCFADILAQSGIVGLADKPGPTVGVLDLADVPCNDDGSFRIVLSPNEPAERDAYWWRVDPRADQLWVRQVADDWSDTVDAPVSIVRADLAGPNASQPATDPADVARFVTRYVRAWSAHIGDMRERGLVNTLEVVPLPDETGQVAQSYYQGLFDLTEHEALLLTVTPPQRCRYWNVQLTDRHFVTIDWLRHQSSLNSTQATVDNDGVFRAVISRTDPGIANWLDPGTVTAGTILGRWNRGDAHPVPTITPVRLNELADVLPSSTEWVHEDERAESLRQRSAAAQRRRRW